jgi:hypothetical protein
MYCMLVSLHHLKSEKKKNKSKYNLIYAIPLKIINTELNLVRHKH